MKPLNKIIAGPILLAVAICIFTAFSAGQASAQTPTIFVGNPLSASGSADTLPPLVILGEYNAARPSSNTTVTLPSGTIQDVRFYGQNYAFTLYVLACVSSNFFAGEQTFQVVSSESFTNGAVASPGMQTNAVTNLVVNTGDFLAFAGTGPYYFTNNSLDAAYGSTINVNPSIATPPGGPGTTFTVGTNGDTGANYQYIPGSPNRTYACGVDIFPGYTYATIVGQATNRGSADGLGTNALFNLPESTTVASNFDIFVADTSNNTIRKIITLETNWLVTTIAGSAFSTGSTDGIGTNALFLSPAGIAVSSNETLFVSDTGNDTIRMITPGSDLVTTIAGLAGFPGSSDGSNHVAQFSTPTGIAVDSKTNIFVADTTNSLIRKITLVGTNWIVTTIAGSITNGPGSHDGTNGVAQFRFPRGIAIDQSNNLGLCT